MSAGRLFRHVRLLPAVMTLAAALLVIKGEGLIEARAQDGKSAPHIASSAQSDPASDDTQQGSASTVDVLTSLSHRRAQLDAREQELTTRENLIAAAAKRVDQRITELKALQAKLQSLLGQRDAAGQKQFDQLVKSYSSMRPKDAARIFNALSDEVLVPVASAMKADVLGAILAQMQPEAAQKLTVKLANRLNPQKIETQAAQLAATGASAAAAPLPATTQAPAPSAATSTPAQPDAAQAMPPQAPPPQQTADNSAATPPPPPPQSQPAQSAAAQPASTKPSIRHRRAKRLAAMQTAFTKRAPVQSQPPQVSAAAQPANAATRPQQTASTPQAANTAQHPTQQTAPASSAPVPGSAAKSASQQPQPAPQRTAQTTTTAPVSPTAAPVAAPPSPSAPAGK